MKQQIHHVSDTAFWIAAYRAQETKRPDALFRDPLAEVLLGERGKALSKSMQEFELYASWSLVLRTCVIDEFLNRWLSQGHRTVINLGAGLDTRPYRMNLPPDAHWIEMDFPDMMEMKNEMLASHPPRCRLERIGIDLSNRSARLQVLRELNSRISPAVVLTEGVIPYLTEATVRELGQDLQSQSQIQCWIAEYYSKELYSRFQSDEFRKKLGDSPFQFFPEDWFAIFSQAGWHRQEIRYLYDEGEKRNRPFPLPFWVKPLKALADPEKFAERMRLQGYAVLTKAK